MDNATIGTRVLVVDDDKQITRLLQRALAYEGYEVRVAYDGNDGLAQALHAPPNLVVLDVMLPGIDGMEVCRRLRHRSQVPILMLTANDAVADRVAGLEIGADDYVVKPFALEELLARIKAVLRRNGKRTDSELLVYADLILDTGGRVARRGERVIVLSTTEYELLLALMRRPGQVLTREILMDQVWGERYSGESNVLEVYVRYLRQKLEADGEERLIQTVRGAGYVLRERAA